jgi:predicted RNA-binding protein YlxR (DUF448 family)
MPDPVRTCVGCRERAAKRELIRVVAGPDGTVLVDRRARMPGRGAYLHRDATCWAEAVRRGSLARALRTGLSPDGIGTLLLDLEGPEGAVQT